MEIKINVDDVKVKEISLEPDREIEIKHSDGEKAMITRFRSAVIPVDAKIMSATLVLDPHSREKE